MTFLKSVLVVVDDAAPSQYAIDAGLGIARADGAAVLFAVVLNRSLRSEDCNFASIRELAEQIAAKITGAARARAAEAGVTATSEVFFDEPVRGIIGLAEFEGAGMIVMGMQAQTGIVHALSRNIAERVLRETSVPLCIVRKPPPSEDYHRLLVPVIDDELSPYTIDYAVRAAQSLGSKILFCTIATGASPEAEQYLQAARNRALENGVESEWVVVPQEGHIAANILERSRIEECDAIVMASRPREGLARLRRGDVAQAVIRSSDIPVVVLRAVRPAYTSV